MTMHPDTHHPMRPFTDDAPGLPVAPQQPPLVCPGSFALGACLGLFVGLALATLAMLRIC